MEFLLANIHSLNSLAGNFYLADFFDVLIIAFLIYIAILLFKQTKSILTIVGVGLLLFLFALSQIFNLYLTSIVLRSFFSAFIVVLVVIFQEELRRFFEFIAAWSTRKNKGSSEFISSAIEELASAIFILARQKVGALVVLTGTESIERHLEGGKALDGLISEELLLSIFDPSTPGHDGALIIEGGRARLFGVQLPLSTNFKEIGKHGTRHSAALGVAERVDALAIVVSEERGTISLAFSGTFIAIKNIDELKTRIVNFLRENFPEEAVPLWSRLLKKNSFEKLLSFGIATMLWLFVAYPADIIQRDFIIPITYKNLPENLFVDHALPEEISVTFGGRGENVFETIDPQKLEVAIDGELLHQGQNNIRIDERMIERPLALSVVKIGPSVVRIAATQHKDHIVPVEIKTKGSPAKGYTVERIEWVPNHIRIFLPEGIDPPLLISAEVDIAGIKESKSFATVLSLPAQTRLKNIQEQTVSVQVTVTKK